MQPCLRALQDAGVDVERRLSREKLPSHLLYDPSAAVSSRSTCLFVKKVARKEGIEDIALLGSQKDNVENLEPWVRYFLSGAATLGQLLQRNCRLAKRYIPYRVYTHSQENGLALVCITSDASLRGEAFLRLSDWSNLLLLLQVVRRVLGPNFAPTAIRFETKAPLTGAEREALQGVAVFQG